MIIEDFIQRLEDTTHRNVKKSGDKYLSLCPAHDDSNPSLCISESGDGKILLKCFAGCSVEKICASLHIPITSLFRKDIQENPEKGGTIEYVYTDEEGNPLYKKIRTPGKQFFISSYKEGIWKKGLSTSKRVLYHLPEVIRAKNNKDYIFLVEGEKDADNLRFFGLTATTPIEGAGSHLSKQYVDQLTGCHIVLLYDEDEAGYSRRDLWIELLAGKAATIHLRPLIGLEDNSGKDVSDWLQEGHTIEELLASIDKADAMTFPHGGFSKRLHVCTLSDFLSKPIPQRKMIVDPILPHQGLILLYSKRGVGKTFLALALGYAIATGRDFLHWKCREAKKILYVDGEMPASTMQERLGKLSQETLSDLPDSSYFRLITPDLQEEGIPDLSTSKGQILLEEVIEDAEVLILDNLSTLAPTMQENEADSWTSVQQWILKLRKKGISVIIVHHAGKGGQQRGTSRREDVLDTVIVLKHSQRYSMSNGACFEIHIEKARNFYGETAEPFLVRLQINDKGFLSWEKGDISSEDTLYNQIVEGVRAGISYRDLSKQLGINKSRVESAIKRAREKGDLPKKG